MDNTIQKQEKLEYIKWFMSTKEVASPKAKWLLTKFTNKTSNLIARVHFTRNESIKHTMTVAACDYEVLDEEDFVCTLKGENVDYRTFYNYFLSNTNEHLYLEFKFKDQDKCEMFKKLFAVNDVSLDSVLIDIFLENLIVKNRLKQLEKTIDQALLTYDPHDFYHATAERKELLENYPLI